MFMKHVVVVLLMAAALAVEGSAQGPQGDLQTPRRGPLPGGRMGPARDPREQQTGTSVIRGRVVDEFGEPVAMARVQVMRYQAFQGLRRLMPVGIGDQTDDTGAYRLYGLSPGDYYVSAVLRGGGMMGPDAEDTNYAPTYYPGTGNVAEAQRVTIALGQEHPNISFSLLPTRTVKVTGTVVDSQGKPLTNGFVTLVDAADMPGAGGMFMIGGGNG